MRLEKSIVLLQLKGPGQRFSFDDAFALLSDLENNMPSRNPYCLADLSAHLGDESLSTLQQTVIRALEKGRAAEGPAAQHQRVTQARRNQSRHACRTHSGRDSHVGGVRTANQLESELVDLVDGLAEALGRPAREWKGGSAALAIEASNQRRSPKGRLQLLTALAARRSSASAVPQARSTDAYIVHHPEAEEHAKRLQGGLERTLTQTSMIEVPTLPEDMARCLEQVASSKYVVLLRCSASRGRSSPPFERSWHACPSSACARVPIVCVVVGDSGCAHVHGLSDPSGGWWRVCAHEHVHVYLGIWPYHRPLLTLRTRCVRTDDFGGARHHLEHLNEVLDEAAVAQISSALSHFHPPQDVPALQDKLVELIPHIISVVYDPAGTDHQLAATARDIHDNVQDGLRYQAVSHDCLRCG